MIIVINTDKNTFVGRFESLDLAEAAMAHVRFNPYFVGEPKELESFSGAQLVSIYNSTLDKDKDPVKKFATKGVALDRTWSALKDTAHAPDIKLDKGAARCKYPGFARIHLTMEKSPRREKSKGAQCWELYEEGMTVADFTDKLKDSSLSDEGLKHFYHDVKMGWVELEQ